MKTPKECVNSMFTADTATAAAARVGIYISRNSARKFENKTKENISKPNKLSKLKIANESASKQKKNGTRTRCNHCTIDAKQ